MNVSQHSWVNEQVISDTVIKPLTAGLWVFLIMTVLESSMPKNKRVLIGLVLVIAGTLYLVRRTQEQAEE